MQTSYDSKLNNATYDALKAFQLNTINSSTSDLSNSKLRDIEASVNSFFNSIASNFNMAGYNKDILTSYVPALVYTMYDGYYIYSPYTNIFSEEDYNDESTYKPGERISGLKPYIYYSSRYVKGGIDVVISYTLDNYITIQGTINGNSVMEYGYLISDCSGDGENSATYRGIPIGTENLTEYGVEFQENANGEQIPIEKKYTYTKVNGVKYYKDGDEWFSILNGERYKQNDFKEINNAAIKYYTKAAEFRKFIQDNNLDELTTADAVDEEGNKTLQDRFGNYKIFDFDGEIAIEEPNSNFNQHRLAVIRYSIEKNLSIAIANYNNYTDSTANFQMPKLSEDEWEKITNHISIISFLQGLNIGGKVYNGYSIITNTKNEEVVSEDSIYITTADGTYHKPTEKSLENQAIIEGVLNIDFERKSLTSNTGVATYFFPKKQLGSYNSIVNQTDVEDVDNIYDYMVEKGGILAKSYFTALGRERYSMYKTNNNRAEMIAEFS